MSLELVVNNAKRLSQGKLQQKKLSDKLYNPNLIFNELDNRHAINIRLLQEFDHHLWYHYVGYCKNNNLQPLPILKYAVENWPEIVSGLAMLHNTRSIRRISNWHKLNFTFRFYFRHIRLIYSMYAYGEYYPEDIFIQKIKPEIAFNFFNSVLRKIPPEKAQFFYSMIPKDKERHYCGFIKSLELWRSIKLEGKPYKKLWYEPEEFKFEGRTLKLPWQIDDHYFKATSNSGFTVASKKLGFNLREFILAPPEDVWIIPPLMVLERLNEQNIVLVVSDDVRILRSVESLVGCIYALTTSRLAALITGSSISKWRKSLPSDRDLILDETNSLIDQAFRAPLGVVARLNAEYEYDQELPWLSNYFTYRFRHDLPLVCTYLRKNVDRLTNLVLFKEIATLYPENIASVLSGYASVMVIKDTK